MIVHNDLDRVETVHFHVQCCPWLFSVLCLWLCRVDPFSCAQFLGYTMISMPTKSGCFLFKWEILHEMSQLSSALPWSTGLYRFSVSPRSYRKSHHWCYVGITSKGACSPHHSGWKTAGLLLHISRTSHFLSPFWLHCPLHFEFSSTATQALKLMTSEALTL